MSRPINLDSDGNPIYNIGIDLTQMIDDLPPGLEREILRIMHFHRGRQNAISRTNLMRDLASLGFIFEDDRPIRLCINQLRKSGQPGTWICSTGGKGGGYWLAASPAELEQYISHEAESRLKDFAKQVRAMRAAAKKYWGIYSPEKQASLF